MNEFTSELVKNVAQVWKDGGGDAMGFHWCWRAILAEITRRERPNEPAPTPDSIDGKQA